MDTPAFPTAFVQKIFELRKRRQSSQSQLGKVTHTSGVIVGRYESGKTTPPIEVARKLADALEFTLDYLVSESDFGVKDKITLQLRQELEALSRLCSLSMH